MERRTRSPLDLEDRVQPYSARPPYASGRWPGIRVALALPAPEFLAALGSLGPAELALTLCQIRAMVGLADRGVR